LFLETKRSLQSLNGIHLPLMKKEYINKKVIKISDLVVQKKILKDDLLNTLEKYRLSNS
jgi:hypothetical protein